MDLRMEIQAEIAKVYLEKQEMLEDAGVTTPDLLNEWDRQIYNQLDKVSKELSQYIDDLTNLEISFGRYRRNNIQSPH